MGGLVMVGLAYRCRYIKEMDSNASDNSKQTALFNFFGFNLQDVGHFDRVCYIEGFRQTGNNFYMSCPNCKKIVHHQFNSSCSTCSQHYQAAKYRYILSLNLTNHMGSIWATAYDEVCEKLLGEGGGVLPAEAFAKMNDHQMQTLLQRLRFKLVKLRMVTKKEEFNNQTRTRTNILKTMQLDYAHQTHQLLSTLTHPHPADKLPPR